MWAALTQVDECGYPDDSTFAVLSPPVRWRVQGAEGGPFFLRVASVPGASYGFIFPPPFDGSTVAPSGTVAGQEIELSAEVQPAPAIASIGPASGSITGVPR